MASTDGNLKQQFQALQQQQQQKMYQRKQKKDEKEKQKKSANLNSTSYDVEDDLGLKVPEPDSFASHISEELVEHLNNELRELKDENGRLYKLLNEKQFENKLLKKKTDGERAALADAGVSGLSNDAAASKIVDLSKKIREMSAEYESERTKCRQLQMKCSQLEKEVMNLTAAAGQGNPNSMKTIHAAAVENKTGEVDVKAIQDKVKLFEGRTAELRMQNQLMKQELQKAFKVLSQEVGENINVQTLLGSPSNWRGRAQQIILLQKKVSELKNQVKQSQSRDDVHEEEDILGSNASSSMAGRRVNADERQHDQLRRLQKERKEQQERALAEFKALEEDYDQLKQKFEALKSRNKVMSNENKTVKQQMQTLLQKGQHDDQLISALMKQQEQLRLMLDDSSKIQERISSKAEEHLKQMSQKTMQDTNLVEQMKKIISDKEEQIQLLEDENNTLKLSSLYSTQENEVATLFERSSSSMTSKETAVKDAKDMTLESCYRSGHSNPSSPFSRNSSHTDYQISNSINRPSSTSNISRMEELQVQSRENKLLQQAAEVERDKLSELCKLLQIRFDEATARVAEAQGDLQAQKRRNVLLEKQLGKSKMEHSKTGSNKKGFADGRSFTSANLGDEVVKPVSSVSDIEELETRLAIQQDENAALKAALHSTLKAKEEDLNLYHQTLEETKKVFIQGLRQFKQKS